MAKKNGNGKSGRPKKPAPAPDSYRSDRYKDFLHRIDANASDLNGARAHQRELIKAEANQGMNKRAHEFVQKLRTAVRNDKMTAQDAIATLECVDTYAEWAGLKDQGDMLRGDDKPSAEETVAAKATGKNGSGGKAEGAFKKA